MEQTKKRGRPKNGFRKLSKFFRGIYVIKISTNQQNA